MIWVGPYSSVWPVGFLRSGEGTLATYGDCVLGRRENGSRRAEKGPPGPNIRKTYCFRPSGGMFAGRRRDSFGPDREPPPGLPNNEKRKVFGPRTTSLTLATYASFRPSPPDSLAQLPAPSPEPWRPTDPTDRTKPCCTTCTVSIEPHPLYVLRALCL